MCEMNDPEITPEEKAERIGDREREIADERTAQRRDDMTNDSISHTPLTDAAMVERSRINGPPNSGATTGAKGFEYVVSVEVARQLERENAKLREALIYIYGSIETRKHEREIAKKAVVGYFENET